MHTFVYECKERKVPKVDEDFKVIEKDGELVMETFPPLFQGEVVLRVPSYDDRMDITKECAMQINEQEISNGTHFDSMKKLVSFAKKHIKSCDLVKESNGREFKDPKELEYDDDGGNLLLEIGGFLRQGVSLGKSSGAS